MKIALIVIFIFVAFPSSTGIHDIKACLYAKGDFNACNNTYVKSIHSKHHTKSPLYKNNIKRCNTDKTKNLNHYFLSCHLRNFIKSLLLRSTHK